MKFLLLLALILPMSSKAMITARQRHLINNGASNSVVSLGSLLHKNKNLVRVTWDYRVDGGAVGTIIPKDKVIIPDNAIITRTWVEGITAITSSGAATVHWHVQADQDLVAALDYNHYTAGFLYDGVSQGPASVMKKMTADRQVVFVASTTALTAGKVDMYIEYVLGN